jgi:hypothetical protein
MIQFAPLTAAERAARGSGAPSLFAKPPSIAEHMAVHMVDIGEGCRDSDLMLRGFTPGEIYHHGAEANRIAIARSGGGSC